MTQPRRKGLPDRKVEYIQLSDILTDDLTRTQLKILKVLADGMPHSRYEMHRCLNDELQPVRNVRVHLCHIRKKLDRHYDILCVFMGKYSGGNKWRLVRLLFPRD